MLQTTFERIKERPGFVYPYLGFLIIGALWLFYFPKGEEVLLLNRHYREPFNSFFKYLTHLGDGLAILPVAAIAAFFGWRRSVAVVAAGFGSGILAQFFKRIVFSNAPRPSGYFPEGTLQTIEGVTQHAHNSFPSGHSTAIFSLAVLLVLWLPNRWSFVLYLIAILTGISRLYLAQHFLEDVLAGSLLGAFCAILVYELTQKWIEGQKV